jgi:hypothetical protein
MEQAIKPFKNTYIQTNMGVCLKMADDVCESIENAFNIIVSTTERSGNVKKELKQTIFETVSTLRKLIVKLTVSRNSKTSAISELEDLVFKMTAELDACRGRNAEDIERHLLPDVQRTYNKHNQHKNICDNHSSLDTKCPRLLVNDVLYNQQY